MALVLPREGLAPSIKSDGRGFVEGGWCENHSEAMLGI